ncbi:MAG: hypothetical protein KIT11_11045 [Fimbriimonadaceae bacterium]|nr:hypothetical protein [Fimbriimonadaceae bacterium]QYK55857.1 MAG: hypothetical protein KF733_12715 [Fimbriimonadaceae bacterium]
MKTVGQVALFAFGILVSGCGPALNEEDFQPAAVAPIRAENPKFAAEAGIGADVDVSPGSNPFELAKGRYFSSRPDSFALLTAERTFDRSQRAERFLDESGGFVLYYSPPQEVELEPSVLIDPPPAWRLAGVVISDGVIGLLDMGNRTVDVRPGQRVPDTEWTVVSIDTERAVLRRSGNKLPREFIAPLQGPLAPGGGGGGGGTRGGNNFGGGDPGSDEGRPFGRGGGEAGGK